MSPIPTENSSRLDLVDHRVSLTNFEDFEKSILSKPDFDDLLNDFGTMELQHKSNVMKQSLNNIKRKHLLLNVEKQKKGLTKGQDNNSSPLLSSSGERLLQRRRLHTELFYAGHPNRNNKVNTINEVNSNMPHFVKTINKNDKYKTIRIATFLQEHNLTEYDNCCDETNEKLKKKKNVNGSNTTFVASKLNLTTDGLPKSVKELSLKSQSVECLTKQNNKQLTHTSKYKSLSINNINTTNRRISVSMKNHDVSPKNIDFNFQNQDIKVSKRCLF